ncbi:MAG: single-stranded DNA-binding protein [Holosporales bacterium]|jgi:single-strand DNA-binding protein|nr:single-stranded DNA-binding protein [Holosporales bacterium]
MDNYNIFTYNPLYQMFCEEKVTMAMSINKVILVGNLGRDPEIRLTQDGGKFASFSVATSEYFKDRNTGERTERTEWHRITVFSEHLVELVEKYLKKGSKIYLEGQLQTRKWTDQQGIERYTTDVVLSRFSGNLVLLDKVAPVGGDSGAAVQFDDVAAASQSASPIDDIPF